MYIASFRLRMCTMCNLRWTNSSNKIDKLIFFYMIDVISSHTKKYRNYHSFFSAVKQIKYQALFYFLNQNIMRFSDE